MPGTPSLPGCPGTPLAPRIPRIPGGPVLPPTPSGPEQDGDGHNERHRDLASGRLTWRTVDASDQTAIAHCVHAIQSVKAVNARNSIDTIGSYNRIRMYVTANSRSGYIAGRLGTRGVSLTINGLPICRISRHFPTEKFKNYTSNKPNYPSGIAGSLEIAEKRPL